MTRFKYYNYNYTKLIPIDFGRQILLGTFEHSLCYLVDHELDQTIFHHRNRNESIVGNISGLIAY